jgi:hypothetical protein
MKTGTDLVKLLCQAASSHFPLLALDPSDSISSAEAFSFRLKGQKNKTINQVSRIGITQELNMKKTLIQIAH